MLGPRFVVYIVPYVSLSHRGSMGREILLIYFGCILVLCVFLYLFAFWCLFLVVPCVGQISVIVSFPGHTRSVFLETIVKHLKKKR